MSASKKATKSRVVNLHIELGCQRSEFNYYLNKDHGTFRDPPDGFNGLPEHIEAYISYNLVRIEDKTNESTGRRAKSHKQTLNDISSVVWLLTLACLSFTEIQKLSLASHRCDAVKDWVGRYPFDSSLEAQADQYLAKIQAQIDASSLKPTEYPKRTRFTENAFPLIDRNPAAIVYSNPLDTQVLNSSKLLTNLEQNLTPVSRDNLTVVESTTELTARLKEKIERPIFWQGFAQHHPLRGLPESIPDLFQRLQDSHCDSLNTYDISKPVQDRNSTMTIPELQQYFASPHSTGVNCLDIRNGFAPGAPAQINEVDALRIAFRNRWNPSKACPIDEDVRYIDREFFLVSSKGCISSVHTDTAGQLTYIVGIAGCKTWYLPNRFDVTETLEVMKEYGAETPEAHGAWIKMDIQPGDLLIMPPGCPHAVYTPEHSLTFGGTFYTWLNLGTSLHALAAQAERDFNVSNEALTVQDFDHITKMLRAGREYCELYQWAPMMTAKERWKVPNLPFRTQSSTRIPSLLPSLHPDPEAPPAPKRPRRPHPRPERHPLFEAQERLQRELWRQHYECTQGFQD